jgi:hypothetical protein
VRLRGAFAGDLGQTLKSSIEPYEARVKGRSHLPQPVLGEEFGLDVKDACQELERPGARSLTAAKDARDVGVVDPVALVVKLSGTGRDASKRRVVLIDEPPQCDGNRLVIVDLRQRLSSPAWIVS